MVYGDAATIDAMGWRRTFREAGFEAPIYARHHDAHHDAVCQPLGAYRHRPDDLIIFHYTAWSETADFLVKRGYPIVLVYHNVTPPEFFAGIDDNVERETRAGRARLVEFAPRAILGAAKSEFSRRDLVEAGIRRTCVIPVRVDFDALDQERNEDAERHIRSLGPSVMVMGRVVPNKKIEDVIRGFAFYKYRIEPGARLYCVGSHTPRSPYQIQLDWLVRRLRLDEAVRFTGQVPHADRGAYYRACRVLVTMSEHEGFCAPIVEAMHLGLPVIAYAGGAIPETLGDAGILMKQKDPEVLSELIAMLAEDTPLRRRMIARGLEWSRRYRPDKVAADFAREVSAALEAA